MVVTTDPGRPSDISSNDEDSENGDRQCKKCNLPKPKRSHHCSVCKKCTLKMDHHCPWVNNCVGLNNYRYFVCFLIWVSLGTLYIAAICAPRVLAPGSVLFPDDLVLMKEFEIINQPSDSFMKKVWDFLHLSQFNPVVDQIGDNIHKITQLRGTSSHALQDLIKEKLAGANNPTDNTSTTARMLMSLTEFPYIIYLYSLLPDPDWSIVICFVTCLGVGIGTAILLCFHLYLVFNAQTTIEFFEMQMISARLRRDGLKYVNPYNQGWSKNFEQVFGVDVPWFIGILPYKSPTMMNSKTSRYVWSSNSNQKEHV
eukprot:gene8780-11856_t